MGTPENIEDIVKLVKGAFAPDADPAARKQAATVLRSLVGMLEPGQQTEASDREQPDADVLQRLIDRFQPLIPDDVRENIPSLNIPMVPILKP